MTLPLPTGPTRLILPAIVVWVLVPFTTGELIGEALRRAAAEGAADRESLERSVETLFDPRAAQRGKVSEEEDGA